MRKGYFTVVLLTIPEAGTLARRDISNHSQVYSLKASGLSLGAQLRLGRAKQPHPAWGRCQERTDPPAASVLLKEQYNQLRRVAGRMNAGNAGRTACVRRKT